MTEEVDRPRIYFDTSIFLDAFEGSSFQAERLRSVFRRLRLGEKQAVTSEFTLAELFGKVSDRGWEWQKRVYLDLIVSNNLFDLRPVSRALLIETGGFRKAAMGLGRRVKLGDAIHAVTALDSRCRFVFHKRQAIFRASASRFDLARRRGFCGDPASSRSMKRLKGET